MEEQSEIQKLTQNNHVIDLTSTPVWLMPPLVLLMEIVSNLQELHAQTEQLGFSQQATFTEEEAAKYLRCSLGTIRRYSLRTRQLKYSQIGRNRVYTKVELDRFLSAQRR